MIINPKMKLHALRKTEAGPDFFPTPLFVTHALMDRVCLPRYVWEPCAGMGHMASVMASSGRRVTASDLYDHGVGPHPVTAGIDALGGLPEELDWSECGAIVTNPPYGSGFPHMLALHALERLDASFLALLVRTLWLEGKERRRSLFEPHPPSDILVFDGRFSCQQTDLETPPRGMINYSWFVWDRRAVRSPASRPAVRWIDTAAAYRKWKDSYVA